MSIKSSFKKLTKPTQEKVYFGHPELDGILGNNLKKGTMILIEEDIPTSMFLQLLRYFIGSGINMDQNCMVYDVFDKRWPDMIPAIMNEKRLKQNEQKEKGEEVTNNTIAWRYDQQKIKLKDIEGLISKDIPKIDLSKTHKDEKMLLYSKNLNDFDNLKDLFMDICEQLQNSLQDENDIKLRKICLTNLFGHFSKIKYTNQELVKFLQALKAFCRASHVLLVLSIPTAFDFEKKNTLHFYFDLVFKIEPLLEREELEHFHGMLHFLKFPNLGNFQNFKIEALTWGIKASSKRKLEIDRLYLSPEREQNLQQQQQKQEGQQQQEQQQQQQKQSAKIDF